MQLDFAMKNGSKKNAHRHIPILNACTGGCLQYQQLVEKVECDVQMQDERRGGERQYNRRSRRRNE
jgi:hypothetical protein